MDFGIAKLLHLNSALTHTNAVMGSPSYVAPEVARGDGDLLSVGADVYGLGAVLYQLLTASPPFAGNTTLATLRDVIEKEPLRPSLLNQGVDRDLETIVLKCLRKSVADRYSSTAEVAADLGRWTRREPIAARPLGPFERSIRWAQRHPFYFLLLAALFLSLSTGGAGLAWQWRRAENLRRVAEIHRAAAVQERELARYKAYAADVAMAQKLLNEGYINRASELLEAHVPPNGQPDLRGFDWRYLWDLIYVEPKRRWRASDRPIWWMGQSEIPTQILVAAEGGRAVAAHEVSSGRLVKELSPLREPLSAMASFPEKDRVLFGSAGGELSLRDSRDVTLWSIRRNGPIQQCAFSPDGRIIAASHNLSVSGRKYVQTELFDSQTGELLHELSGYGGELLAFSPNQKQLALTKENQLQLYNLPSCIPFASAPIGTKPAHLLYVEHGSNQMMVLGLENGNLMLLRNGTNLVEIPAHRGGILAVADAGSGYLATLGGDRLLKIWSIDSGTELRRAWLPTQHAPSRLQYAGGELSVGVGNEVFVYSQLTSAKPLRSLPTFEHEVLYPSTNGRLVVLQTAAQETKIIDLQSNQVVATLEETFQLLGFDQTAAHVLLLQRKRWDPQNDMLFLRWSFKEGDIQQVVLNQAGPGRFLLSSAGDLIAGIDSSGKPAIWNTADGFRRVISHSEQVRPLAFAAEGRRLITSSGKRVQIWTLPELDLEREMQFPHAISCGELAPDNRFMSFGLADGTAWVTSFPSLEILHQLRISSSTAPSAVSLLDNHLLMVQTTEVRQRVKIWDLRTGRELITFPETVRSISPLPDRGGFVEIHSDSQLQLKVLPPLPEIPNSDKHSTFQ
jgi:WD40 repeat protein